jgi:cytoskeletal protein CcmA (bactofilin family)
MTWLGQKQDPEPTRPIPTAAAVSPQVPPLPIPIESVKKMETPNVASIGASLHVKGELSGNEDLTIEGTVEGTISLNGYNVTIGPAGRVVAEIQAKSVIIGGQVKGNINASEKVEVAATGTMVGDVRAPRVALVDGARFKGSIDMGSKSAPATSVAVPAVSRATGQPTTSREEAPVYASAAKV